MYNRFSNDATRIKEYRKHIEDKRTFMTQIMIDADHAAEEANMLSRTTSDDKEQLSVAAEYYAITLSAYDRLYRETGLKFARACFEGISSKLIFLLQELGKTDKLKSIRCMVNEFSRLPDLEYRNPDQDRKEW